MHYKLHANPDHIPMYEFDRTHINEECTYESIQRFIRTEAKLYYIC